MTLPSPVDAAPAEPREIGSARLRQVRAFIEQVEPTQPDLMQMLLRALRGRLVYGALIGLAIGIACAIMLLVTVKPLFQSQGLIRIVAREAKILYTDSDDVRLRLFDSFVAAEVNYLSSRPVLDRTLAKLQAEGVLESGATVADLASTIQVTSQKGLVTINGRASNGRKAAAIVNGILDSYADLRIQQAEEQQTFRSRELSTREASLLEKLKAIDGEILRVGQEYGQDAIAKAHVTKINQIQEISGRIDELLTTVNQLETIGYSLDADTGDVEIKRSMLLDNSMASMTYDRAKKAAEASTLAKRYRPDHPKVIAANAEIAVLDKAIEDRSAQISTLGRTGALTQGEKKEKQSLEELRALLSKLQERKKSFEAEARDLIARIVRLGYLKEERSQTRANLDETRRVLEEVRVESRNDSPGIAEVVSRGSVPDRPFEDKRKAMAGIGFAGGLGMGFALIALWGLVRPTVRSEADLAALGRMVVGAGSVEAPGDSVHGLRNSLHVALARQPSDQGRAVGLVGAGRAQGVTTLALSLAHSFRSAGSQTAMVDANLRSPGLTALLGAENEPGLADWIRAARGQTLPLSQADGLALLPAGSEPTGGEHSLGPRDVGTIIDALSAAHDIVIADCGAANHMLASTLFAARCEIVVLVLRRGIALHEARSAVAAILATSRRQVLVVFTGKPAAPVPAWMSGAALAALSFASARVARILPARTNRKVKQ
jgi:polysaccharide biosynthesis transport protein